MKSLLTTVGIVLVGCGGGGDITPPATTVVAKTSGDAQDGIVGQPLAKAIQVLVTESNAPLPGATVTWLPEISDGVFTPASAPTDANGLASTLWTLGPHQGTQIATVRVTGSSTAVVKFTATAVHDVPVTLAKVTGDNQSATVNSPLHHVEAMVADQFANGVAGVGVSWSVSSGSVSPEADISGPGGLSSVQVILGGTVGPVTITATADGLTGSPLTFNATAVVDPTQAEVRLGNRQPDAVVTNVRYRSASSATRGGSQPSSSPISSATRRAANAP